jgi:DNA-binding transcriptional ArsR family regulator
LAEKRKRKSGDTKRKGRWAIDQRLVKALTHELRVEILGILNERIASPNELANELGEGLSQVSYHVKVLRDFECIKLVKTAPRRGAVEHYYRATSRAFLTDRDWHKLPDSIRPGLSADLLELIVGDGVGALEEGTFDARKDRHLSRTLLIVDEPGWRDLVNALKRTRDEVEAIQSKSSARLVKSGESGFTVSAALMGIEIPEPQGQRSKPKGKASAKKAGAKRGGAKKASAKGARTTKRKKA